MPSSTEAAEGAVSDKPAPNAVVVGLADKAPPASQSSSQPRSRKKSTKKGRRKRRPSQKPIKTRTVPSAEKGQAAMSTLQPSTGSPPTHPAATSGVTTAQTALGQQSSMYPTSLAPPDSTAVGAKEAVQRELRPYASASAPGGASQQRKTYSVRTSSAPSQHTAVSKVGSQRATDNSLKALNNLLSAGVDASLVS
ncbi:hypothetical protein V5799_014239 [Amblyomma americanum]|uniref:Uncharacterized protein n=1 Tax=Amblyomma americanum TaxID=6943 RepID=A0AAQ4E3L0_AMBAM